MHFYVATASLLTFEIIFPESFFIIVVSFLVLKNIMYFGKPVKQKNLQGKWFCINENKECYFGFFLSFIIERYLYFTRGQRAAGAGHAC